MPGRSYMGRSQRKFGKAIGVRSARKLIREIGGATDHALAVEWERALGHPLSRPDEEIVRLHDGRVLWISYGSANIYASADAYFQLLALVKQVSRRKPGHSLGTSFPRGQGFIEAVPRLVQELPIKLGLSAQTLNGSVDSLERIDKAVRRFGGQACLDDPEILAPIVAYVGEVMRGVIGGRWEIHRVDLPDVEESCQWQAVIVGANGREYPTFVIFKELLERGSIHAVVDLKISDRRL
jgi:hypothetical protein